MLQVQRNGAEHDIATLDESWFYTSTDYEFVWQLQDEKNSRKRTAHNSIEKFMLTIIWNPRVFQLIRVLEKGSKFNAGYYIAKILEPLSQWRSIEAAGNERKLLVHAHNARPHTAKLSTQYFNEN
jgi:hypothetical protein